MAKTDPADDDFNETEPDVDNPDTWPTRRRAATMLGVSVRTIDRMVASKELSPLVHKGVKRFSPTELQEVNSEGSDNWGAEIKETLNLANESSRLAQEHAKALFSMVTEPATRLHKLLAEENARLTSRVSELENKQIDAVDSMLKVLQLNDEREIAKIEAAEKQKRLTQATELLMKWAPVLLDQMSSSSKVAQLVKGLDKDSIWVLKESGVITQEQFDAIFKIRGEEVIKPPVSEAKKEEKETDNAQSV